MKYFIWVMVLFSAFAESSEVPFGKDLKIKNPSGWFFIRTTKAMESFADYIFENSENGDKILFKKEIHKNWGTNTSIKISDGCNKINADVLLIKNHQVCFKNFGKRNNIYMAQIIHPIITQDEYYEVYVATLQSKSEINRNKFISLME